jgi:hypothetical protein
MSRDIITAMSRTSSTNTHLKRPETNSKGASSKNTHVSLNMLFQGNAIKFKLKPQTIISAKGASRQGLGHSPEFLRKRASGVSLCH